MAPAMCRLCRPAAKGLSCFMLKYLKKYRFTAIIASLFMAGEVSMDLIQPRMMASIVDDGILGIGSSGPDIHLVMSIGGSMLLVVLFGGLCGVLSGVFSNICAQNYGNDIRKDVFRRVMYLSHEQTDRFSVGSLITRITSDVTQVQNMVMQMIRGCVRCGMFFIAGSVCLVTLDLSFSTIIVIALPIILLEIVFILWKTNPLFMLLQRRLDRMNTILQEDVAGARVVKAFVQEKREISRFETSNEELCDTQYRVLILISLMQPVMNIVLNIATVAAIRIGAVGVRQGTIAPGTVMAAITYLSQILNGMMMLAMIFQTISRGITSSRRLREVLETLPQIRDGNAASADRQGAGMAPAHALSEDRQNAGFAVEFRGAGFRYPGQKEWVLRGINLRIRRGETFAVIGSTGCGKSTLVNLIPRFYDCTEGSVLVDGQNVKSWKLADLRSRVAVVLQKSELFSTTIGENIAIGREKPFTDADKAETYRTKSGRMRSVPSEIRTAAKAAQADDFILEQPEGYDTPVAEAGMSLSGGQKQRIAIARGLVRNAEVLILDDSTSALDFKTEARLQDAVRTEYPGMTKIIIAQRIASVRRADRIAVIDGGTIVACAGHEELMRTCPTYIDIYNSQIHDSGISDRSEVRESRGHTQSSGSDISEDSRAVPDAMELRCSAGSRQVLPSLQKGDQA